MSGGGGPVVREPVTAAQVRVVPANEASWADLTAVFGTSEQGRCLCQRLKVPGWIWRDSTLEGRREMLRAQTACDEPDAASTSGMVAYVDGEPAGWVAVEPRLAYPKLQTQRIPWTGRDEDRDDEGVWAVTCFAVRRGYRGRGLTYHLARATVEYARAAGARALEAYPMVVEPGREIIWGDLRVGAAQVFEEAGFTAVHRPSVRRVIMRVEFGGASR
jgi:GNAT superfamily N-acetyltransferase